jgi:hypothetical protein
MSWILFNVILLSGNDVLSQFYICAVEALNLILHFQAEIDCVVKEKSDSNDRLFKQNDF